jgi:uncharacterized repeat protein (TIGR01451 family)
MKRICILLFLLFNLFVSSFAQNTVINAACSSILVKSVAVGATGNIYSAGSGGTIIQRNDLSGIVTVLAGTPSATGYTGDGGPATAALFNGIYSIAVDGADNIYVADGGNHAIRKINSATGIITTIAGNGTCGYSGDGGPSTAARVCTPYGIICDATGSIYFAEAGNAVIRKINTAGIISTVAGTGVWGFSGDGGPATSAQLNSPYGVTLDNLGNMYIADANNYRIRKVNTSGIISTIAGTGVSGYSGDGGPAIGATMNMPYSMAVDRFGNVVFTDIWNNVVRKINPIGTISTVAGNGIAGFSGDGGPATNAELNYAQGIYIDGTNNLFIADGSNNEVRKVSMAPRISCGSFSVYDDNFCNALQLTIVAVSSASLNVKTYFGDGNTDYRPLVSSGLGTESAILLHSYNSSGTYTIKHILYNGAVPVDSVRYSFESRICNTFPVKFFYDANANCVKDSASEPFSYLPVTVRVDSNGIAIDTISTTGGFYYTAMGNTGDVYSFNMLSHPAGLTITCPASGVMTDTLQVIDNSITRYVGFGCSASPAFDLRQHESQVCGRHMVKGSVIIDNTYCNDENPVLTMNFSPKYIFESSVPPAATISGSAVTWNMTGVNATSLPPYIRYTLAVPSTWLTPGDTVQSFYSVTPVSGDADVTNNNSGRIDTVTGSFDPNEISVSPEGTISTGAQLKYTIGFENTGNDTAFNIYVLDTLSPWVDASSYRVLASSGVMNTTVIKYGAQKILKFNFPDINLLDSSHHNLCDGMLEFNVNTKDGLVPGTTIFNRVGIYFDYNSAVMTNTVENIIGTIPVSVPAIGNNKVVVSPNPANDELTIKTENNRYSSLTISNTLGSVLVQQPVTGTQTKVAISSLPPGVYIITLLGNSDQTVSKFVKQ